MGWIDNHFPSDNGRLVFQVLKPSEHLRHHVSFYWLLKCDNRAAAVPELMIPDGLEEIIFSYGGDYHRVSRGSGSQREICTASYIVPLKNTGLLCSRITDLKMIGVKLLPGSLYHLLKTPLDEFFNTTLPLSSVNHPLLNTLESQLVSAATPEAIKQHLDDCLSCVTQFFRKDALTQASVRKLMLQGGQSKISDLANHYGCHYRTLEKRFKERVGCTPKKLSRNIRFSYAFHMSQKNQCKLNAEQLHKLGYYDNSHYYRDFKFYTGGLPGDKSMQCQKFSTDVINATHERVL